MKAKIIILMLTGIVLTSARPVTTKRSSDVHKAGTSRLIGDWIALHIKLIRKTPGLNQGVIAQQFIVSSISAYEAVVPGAADYVSLAGQLQGFNPTNDMSMEKQACWEASANSALAGALRSFFKSNMSTIDSMEGVIHARLSKQGFSEASIRRGEAFGKQVATHVLRWSQQGGPSQELPPYTPPKGDGLWEPTPPAYSSPAAPYLHLSRTCIKSSTDNTLPPAPLMFSANRESEFYRMVNEVYGVSKHLTQEQRAIALFWDDFPDQRYVGGSGHWASILMQVLEKENLSLIKAVEAFATMNVVMNDAFIGCFKGKYTYNLVRPVTYIRKYIDPAWEPLIVTPNHPEYPAAHATISTSAATALTSVLGPIAFTDHTYDGIGFKPRSFASFDEAAREAGWSRLYGGIHYRPSTEAGFVLGKRIAENVLKGLQLRKE